jgi:hypothetical protein
MLIIPAFKIAGRFIDNSSLLPYLIGKRIFSKKCGRGEKIQQLECLDPGNGLKRNCSGTHITEKKNSYIGSFTYLNLTL